METPSGCLEQEAQGILEFPQEMPRRFLLTQQLLSPDIALKQQINNIVENFQILHTYNSVLTPKRHILDILHVS